MKTHSLAWKLTLAFLLVAITAAALMAVLIRATSVDRLEQLVVDQQRNLLQTQLVDYYTQNSSWSGIREAWRPILISLGPEINWLPRDGQLPRGDLPGRDPSRRVEIDRRLLFGLADAQGQVIVAVDPAYPEGSQLPSSLIRQGTPVEVDGMVVGTILTARLAPQFNPAETLFLRRMNNTLVLAAVGALLAAVLVGIILARTLIRPLQALTGAAQAIARGNLEQQVHVRSRDEIGQLADAFNAMSAEVARVNQQRKQMTADIAHDLRTPLTVISGYVESMRDGVLKPTPERLALIYDEIERLQNLVGDLKMLSQADAGELPLHPQAIDPAILLEHAAAPFQHPASQKGIVMVIDAEPALPPVRVDEARMMQVFGNLLSNALRYTSMGGEIRLGARDAGEMVELRVADTGEGIAEEDLPLIFDRFHRADTSRHAETGESGLGLAIVKALVEAHGGTVRAESRLGQGTTIIISLRKSGESV